MAPAQVAVAPELLVILVLPVIRHLTEDLGVLEQIRQ
jgi:hypothetical protein